MKKAVFTIFLTAMLLTACTNVSKTTDSTSTEESSTTAIADASAENSSTIAIADASAENASTTAISDASTENASNIDYQKYNGNWSTNGQSDEDIIANGGAEFYIEIKNNNELNGRLYTQQGISERFAEISDIKGTITDGEVSYPFTDDGWGNSGTLVIHLKDNEVTIEVKDFILSDENTSGYGISGSYSFIPMTDSASDSAMVSSSDETDLQTDDLQKYCSDWQESQVLEELNKRSKYQENCSFCNEVVQYMEEVREVRDISAYLEPLYATDTEYYQISDFDGVPPLIIYLAKNEIYARHGYIFKNVDLNNYFLGQLWYLPEIDSESFDITVLNEYETANLKLLAQLDTYK